MLIPSQSISASCANAPSVTPQAGQHCLQQQAANLSKWNPKFMGLDPENHNFHAPTKSQLAGADSPPSQAVAPDQN